MSNQACKLERESSSGGSTGHSESNQFTSTRKIAGSSKMQIPSADPDPKNVSQSLSETSENLTIFVGGLNSKCNQAELQEYFSRFGSIASCETQMWKKHQARCRGFALVKCGDFHTYTQILAHKQHYFSGRNIECKQFVTSKDELLDKTKLQIDKKIFVGCIPEHATNDQLRDTFAQVGEIEISYIIKKTPKKCPMNRVFGYVSFKSKEVRDKALKIRNFTLAGAKVTCVEYSTKFQHKELEEGFLMNQELLKSSFKPTSALFAAEPLFFVAPFRSQSQLTLFSHLQPYPSVPVQSFTTPYPI